MTQIKSATNSILEPAGLADAPGIYQLLKAYSDIGLLLPRPESDIYRSIRDFYVVRRGSEVVACGALMIYTQNLGEVRSLAVSPEYNGMGFGQDLVTQIERDAISLGLSKLMALTYVVGFFERLGYQVVEMSVLPEKVWGACINCHKFRNCDEIAVLKYISEK